MESGVRFGLGEKKKKSPFEKQFVSTFCEQGFQTDSVSSAVQLTGLEKNTE